MKTKIMTQIEINNVSGGNIDSSVVIFRNKDELIGYSGKISGYVDMRAGELKMTCDSTMVLMNTTGLWTFDCNNLNLLS